MATNQQILDAILALTATLAAKAEPVAPAPASSHVAPTFATKAMRESGEGFPCTVALADGQKPCTRVLRTSKRAAAHGTEAGHEYRS